MFNATFRIKIYLPNKKFFISFLDFEQNLFELLTRSFCALFSQLQLRVHSNVFIKNIFFKKIFFEKFFRFYAEFFHVLVRKFTTELTKVHFLCPKITSWKKKHFEKNKTYLTFTDLTELFLRFGMKLQQSYQIFTFCARRFFWAKTFVLKKRLITELFRTASENFPGGFFKKTSKVSRGKFSLQEDSF